MAPAFTFLIMLLPLWLLRNDRWSGKQKGDYVLLDSGKSQVAIQLLAWSYLDGLPPGLLLWVGFICSNLMTSPHSITKSTSTLRIFKSNKIKWVAHKGLFAFKFGPWALTYLSGLWTCNLSCFQLVFDFSNSENFHFHSIATMLPVPYMQIVQGMPGLAVAASVLKEVESSIYQP